MKYIDVKYWSKQNRIERIRGNLPFKGRSYLPRNLLGEGKPKSMTEDEKWNPR